MARELHCGHHCHVVTVISSLRRYCQIGTVISSVHRYCHIVIVISSLHRYCHIVTTSLLSYRVRLWDRLVCDDMGTKCVIVLHAV